MKVLTRLFMLTTVLAHSTEGQERYSPPANVGKPSAIYATTNRAFTGIPSIAVTRGGRLWATWYAGKTPGENENNYVVLATSGDDGATWKEVVVTDPDYEGERRSFDPNVWYSPDGKICLFWADGKRTGLYNETWMLEVTDAERSDSRHTAPRYVTCGVALCKPVVLSTGEWSLPVCTWKTPPSTKMAVSTDHGKTWLVRGGCQVPPAAMEWDEPMMVERKDGSLWMLVRTNYGLGESFSHDRGRTWTEVAPSPIAHTVSRFFITRLSSGNLLLVKHGPIKTKTGRSHLMAFVSRDDGATWSDGLMLDERKGVSYPDGQQAADGRFYLVYDYNRYSDRQILMAVFCEEDVQAGKDVSGNVRLRLVVSQGSGGQFPSTYKGAK